jgi:polyribonucleotide nucleotidyltransferase
MDKKLIDDYIKHVQDKQLNEGVVVGTMAVVYIVKLIERKVKEAAKKARETAKKLYEVTSSVTTIKEYTFKAQIKAYKTNQTECNKSTNPKYCRKIIEQKIKKLEKKLRDLK